MRAWIALIETAQHAPDLKALFRDEAWHATQANLSDNESELEDYVDRYEDETGSSLNIPPGRSMERGCELLDPAFTAWLKQQVTARAEDLADEFAGLIKNNSIRGWRAMTAAPTWRPEPGVFLGQHWTRTRDQAIAHFGSEGDETDDGSHEVTHIIEADLPLSSIDWYATVKANLSEEFGEEDEITLNDDAPVSVVRSYIEGSAQHKAIERAEAKRIAKGRAKSEAAQQDQRQALIADYQAGRLSDADLFRAADQSPALLNDIKSWTPAIVAYIKQKLNQDSIDSRFFEFLPRLHLSADQEYDLLVRDKGLFRKLRYGDKLSAAMQRYMANFDHYEYHRRLQAGTAMTGDSLLQFCKQIHDNPLYRTAVLLSVCRDVRMGRPNAIAVALACFKCLSAAEARDFVQRAKGGIPAELQPKLAALKPSFVKLFGPAPATLASPV